MLRSLYACIVRLHPRRFRERFGAEMLWIFDEAVQSRGGCALVADVCASLVRQWAFRADAEEEPLAAVVSDVPLFATAAASGPRPAALAEGVLVSVLAFAAVSLSIGHWRGPRVIHYTGGWTLFETAGDPGPRAGRESIEELRRGAGVANERTPAAGAADVSAMHDPSGAAGVPEEAAAARILEDAMAKASQPGVPAAAGRIAAPRISAAQAALIMFMLDRNRDGKITDGEWQALWKLMERADTNKDGIVTLEELCAAPPM